MWSDLLQNVYKANGFVLSIVGMTVVFCGLLTLFVTMLVLKVTTTGRKEKKMTAQADKTDVTIEEEEEMDMDEVAAAIGLALNFHVLRNSPKKMTIKRLSRSSWKESLRARAMERL